MFAKESKIWSQKIEGALQKHGLNILGARINYKETILMIEDVHLAELTELTPLQFMLVYKKWRSKGV